MLVSLRKMLSFPQGLTTASLDQDLTTEICRFTTQIQVLFLSHYATVHIVGIYPRNYLMIQALEGNSVWGQGKEDFFFLNVRIFPYKCRPKKDAFMGSIRVLCA